MSRKPDKGKSPSRQAWRRWVEPWYLAYALQGATVAGLTPILLPLAVSHTGSAAHIGLVMAAVSLGGMTAPLWGGLADRYRLHRWLLAGGLLVTAGGLAAFPFTTQPAVWFGLALLQGIGAAAAATVANLFIVEGYAKREWDERIGWLQTFYGGGQVAGLLLAAALSATHLRAGLLTAAGLTALGALLGLATTQAPSKPKKGPRPVLLAPARHGEWPLSSPQRLFHHLTAGTLTVLSKAVRSPFGLFLLAWLLAFGGSAAVFSLYPVLMRQLFGLAPSVSSSIFALAAGLGLLLYSPAGIWSDRWGPGWVLRAGFGLRLLAFAGLLGLGLVQFGGASWLALGPFVLVVLSWSLLTVSGTALTAKLSPVGEGEGMGLYNAVTAAAGVLGSALGGWAAGLWGYNAASAMAVAGVALGLLLAICIRFKPAVSRQTPTTTKGRTSP
jgi:DHA1 family tetracycline resistance protein-like MFS transporter